MHDERSRYYGIEHTTMTLPDGRSVSYLRRRIVPMGDSLAIETEVTLSPGERLDQLAAHMLGDPEQYWRICDASNAMNPLDLLHEPGRSLRIPLIQPEL
jgi:hypothetical protein